MVHLLPQQASPDAGPVPVISVYSIFFLLLLAGGYFIIWRWIVVNGRWTSLPSVNEVAFFMQTSAKERLGEREFARRLLEFDERVGGDLEQALAVLAAEPEPPTKQIAYCWLARRGYGNMPVNRLWHQVEEARYSAVEPDRRLNPRLETEE